MNSKFIEVDQVSVNWLKVWINHIDQSELKNTSIQWKLDNQAYMPLAQEDLRDWVAIGFSLESHRLRKRRKFSEPITQQSWAKPFEDC